MTRPFSAHQKLRILIAHGAVVMDGHQLVPLHHVLHPTRDASRRLERLRGMAVAVRCACRGELSQACDGTRWMSLCDVQFDHHLADVFGGATHQSNGRPLAAECHGAKTAGEQAANARVHRLRRKHFGQRPKPKRAWPSRPLRSRSSWPKCPSKLRGGGHAVP